MGRSFWELLWESLKSVFTAVIGIVALLLSVLLWAYTPDTQMSLRVIVPVGALILMLLIAALITATNAAYEANRATNDERQKYDTLRAEYDDFRARGGAGLPKVIEGKHAPMGTQAALTCVLAPSPLFSEGHMVSFYSMSSQRVESFVGIGFVELIQGDRKIHATMVSVQPGQEPFAQRLLQNEREALETTVVRPGIPRRYTNL